MTRGRGEATAAIGRQIGSTLAIPTPSLMLSPALTMTMAHFRVKCFKVEHLKVE